MSYGSAREDTIRRQNQQCDKNEVRLPNDDSDDDDDDDDDDDVMMNDK